MTKMDNYQSFIAKSRYSRFLTNDNRRENWTETVDRYFTFLFNHIDEKYDYSISNDLRLELISAVKNLEVMPSMRAIMTAGKALERDNTAGYNCSYLPVDDPKAFDEAMYILLCGTGVGFSVEQQYVNQLPEVPDQLFDSKTTIVVSDSKEGWAKSLRQLIALLYSGEIPKWDVSKVRPAGERLKTFGGRASGPGPLEELFKFAVSKFKGACGRRLSSIECHDLLCKIGEVVVVGGVRRSAMISLSDLQDDKMRHAKAGAWWEQNGQRALANNSATYTQKPDIGQFLDEWTSLYHSHSGERGIFSRAAAISQVTKTGRRDPNHQFGTNPCSEIILRPYQFCNLTEVVVRAEDTVETLENKVKLATILGTLQSTLTHFPYLRKIWQKNTEEERLLGVSFTGIFDNKWMSEITDETKANLERLKNVSISTNADIANSLGITASCAITCVKPSGTVSQLVDSASGIHARHSRYYIRRVRGDKKDPLTKFMMDNGVPAEDCVMRPESTAVFSFPQKAPEGATLRDDLTAVQHLDVWLMYQRHWSDHKPSVTISVKEHEWMDVGAWVWRNFDEVSGVSFLPYADSSYRQMPYEECTKEQYEELLAKMPQNIDWDQLKEETDNVEGAQMLACSSGSCEI
jgi:ribonucleoside-diphosphate reductase alpha chain